MAAAPTSFFANHAYVVIADGVTEYTVGILRNVEITLSWEHVPLYGMDSIKMQDIAKHSQKIEIKVKYAKFDPTLAEDFLQDIIHPGTSPDGSIEDTNYVKQLTLKAEIQSFDSTPLIYNVVVTGVYFESLPLMQLTENEWVARDFTGQGMDLTISNTTIQT